MTAPEFRAYLCALACPVGACKQTGNVFTVARHCRDAHGWPIEEAAQWLVAIVHEAENPPQGALFTPGHPPDADLALRDP